MKRRDTRLGREREDWEEEENEEELGTGGKQKDVISVREFWIHKETTREREKRTYFNLWHTASLATCQWSLTHRMFLTVW